MSSYIDSRAHELRGRTPTGEARGVYEEHCWADFTNDRLAWLYGADHKVSRAAQTAADLTAWRGLGERDAA